MKYSYRLTGYPFGTVPATYSPTYLWDLLDDAGLDYRIYGENYFLFTRAYRTFNELYGADSQISRRFYDKAMAAANGEDRGQEFNNIMRPYYGRVHSPADGYNILGESEFRTALSHFLVGDDLFARMIERDEKLRRKFGAYLSKYSFSFRSWDLKVSDLDRVREWQKDFEAQLKSEASPNFITFGCQTITLMGPAPEFSIRFSSWPRTIPPWTRPRGHFA
jgi:hypothetical protein